MSVVGLGIDLGGTKIKGIRMEENGRILQKVNVPTGNTECEEEVMGNLFAVIEELLGEGSPVSIGVGSAGSVDFVRQVVAISPNIAFLQEYPLRQVLQDRFQLPILIENDVKVGALGELHFGEGKGISDFVFVALGTGIGGAIVHEGKLLRGVGNAAGEIGHLTLEQFGLECGCGKLGCYEALAAGPAIRRYFLYALRKGRRSSLEGWKSEDIATERIAEAARQGDELAMEVFRTSAFHTGLALSYLVNLLNPARIILGGGMSEALDLMWDTILGTLTLHAMDYPLHQVEIVASKLGNEAGVLGAAMMGIYHAQGEL